VKKVTSSADKIIRSAEPWRSVGSARYDRCILSAVAPDDD